MDAMDSDRTIDKTSIPQMHLTGFGGTVARKTPEFIKNVLNKSN
ncbi:hypothetical protein SAMN02583745_02878 [Thorsellia anophelis DSM 18579]|uniref:Uncharacterized protein n=1 Tax=Thorsellia anophelis DSM 18579 TaxID=1123402 RepID=A0A1I0FSB3_9GAMM|nr:hypothetical protein SAMN02583745_02878 [Thorsellia anophelis DSM 18579]